MKHHNVTAIKCLALIFLIFMSFCNKGFSEGFKHGILEPASIPFQKGVRAIYYRKILRVAMIDYDDAEANTKHEPRKGKPGSGGN